MITHNVTLGLFDELGLGRGLLLGLLLSTPPAGSKRRV
jgi:hypothetical protein